MEKLQAWLKPGAKGSSLKRADRKQINRKLKGADLVLPFLEECIMRMYGLESIEFSGDSDAKKGEKKTLRKKISFSDGFI